MKKCFGYIRVSTLKQGEGVSLEAQKDSISEFAARNDILISQWFEEKVTAAKSGRPLFTAMVKQLLRGEAQGLVVHKIDRSARNFADWAKIGDLSDAGIDVHFATESLDFRSRGGRLSADIQAVIAADYIRNLREECLKGMRGRLKQGLYPWGAPVGYLNNGKGKPKTPDPAKAHLVQELFELYATRTHSIRTLRVEMTERGLCNSGGRPFSKTGIETILSNPFYCSIIKIKTTGQIYEGRHEPLISPKLFETVQLIKARKAGKKVTRHNHLYGGLFRCGLCATAMIPERQKGHVYYRCHTENCPTTSVREERIEDAILAELAKIKIGDEAGAIIDQRLVEWLAPKNDDIVSPAALQLAQVEQRIARLTDGFINGLIDEPTYLAKKEALFLDRQRCRAEVSAPPRTRPTPDDLMKFLELAKSLWRNYQSGSRVEKRQIIELATSNRIVSGKTLSLTPHDWLQSAQDAGTVLSGAHHRPTNRMSAKHITSPNARRPRGRLRRVPSKVQRLFDAAKSNEVIILQELMAERHEAARPIASTRFSRQ